jgi:hypothetical protein
LIISAEEAAPQTTATFPADSKHLVHVHWIVPCPASPWLLLKTFEGIWAIERNWENNRKLPKKTIYHITLIQCTVNNMHVIFI